MILYLLQTTVALALLLLIYCSVLKHTTSFQFNRFYLLGGLLLALTVPLLPLELTTNSSSLVEHYQEVDALHDSIDYSNNNVLLLGKRKATPLQRIIYYFILIAYFIGSLYFFARFTFNLFTLLSMARKKGPKIRGMQTVLLSHNSQPFSFFHFLYVQDKKLEQVLQSESILLHEEAHFLQKHSLDIVLVEFVQCIFWFNPFMGLYKKAMKENHEYLADQYATSQHPNTQQYLQDLISFSSQPPQLTLGSSFSYLTLKTRITMIQKSSDNHFKKLIRTSIGFVLALMTLLICSFKPTTQQHYKIPPLRLSIRSTVPSLLPIEKNLITKIPSSFGMRMHPHTKTKKMHTGVDIVAPAGTPILATADGIVEKATYSDGYGKHIKIRHNETYQTLYAHLNEMNVVEGEKVKAGQLIGIIGTTGRSLNIHLHYEVIKNSQKVDPSDYFQYEVKEN